MTAAALLCLLSGILLWNTRGSATVRNPERQGQAVSARRRKTYEGSEPIDLVLDLGASLMESGLPMTTLLDSMGRCIPQCAALRTVARCLEMNMEWEKAWEPAPRWLAPLQRSLGFAHATGAPASALLRNTAQLQRRERAQHVARCGAQFATRLVLPLGACALPAFIALGVVPLIIALFPHLA